MENFNQEIKKVVELYESGDNSAEKEFFKIYNRFDDKYYKSCIINHLLTFTHEENVEFIRTLCKKVGNIVGNMRNMLVDDKGVSQYMYYDFKDVGQFVKNGDDIFKVENRDEEFIIRNGEKISISECEPSSISEFRKYKIAKLLAQ
jgi:hypothetical protein